MTDLQEPQGIDEFAEGLSSFDNQEVMVQEQPTAAVQSASLDINKQQPVNKVTIAEPEVKDSDEENIMTKLELFYENNQTMILASLAVGIGYYVYKRQQK